MNSKMTQISALKTTCFLLLLASITQGLWDVPVFHYKTKEALVGQNVSLPCFFENIGDMIYISSEWRRKDDKSTKLALHNSHYGYKNFSPNVSLKIINNDKDQVIGTRLELPNIDKGDAGTYTCEITAFPIGHHRKQTELRIKDMIECDRNSSIEVHSGENVTIHCHEFANVVYTWTKEEVVVSDSSSLHLLSVSVFNAGLYTLTVHTGNSLLHKTFSVTVSSQTTDYWADASTLSPPPENETTRYSPVTTFATENTQKATTAIPILNSQPVNLQNTTDNTTYHTSYIQSESHNTTLTMSTVSEHFNQSETSKGFGQSETYNTTLTYNQSESFDTLSIVSQHFNQSETFNTNVSYNHPITIHTTQPYVNDMSNAPVVYDPALNEAESTTSAPTTFLETAAVTPRPGNTTDTSDVTEQPDPAETEERSYLGLTLLIIGGVLLIIGALILYRRRVLKKRGDLPPPFKPPPPPVKYTAVRNPPQSFPTDRCNSITMQISTEKRQTFV